MKTLIHLFLICVISICVFQTTLKADVTPPGLTKEEERQYWEKQYEYKQGHPRSFIEKCLRKCFLIFED